MRLIGIGLAIALAIGVSAPSVVAAKPKEAPAAGGIDAKSIEKGKADTPALLAKAAVNCTMTNARYVGSETDKKTKVTKAYYEVACQDALGLVLLSDSSTPDKTGVFTCLETARLIDGKPHPLACKLPENLDETAKVQALVQASDHACTVQKTRYIGAGSANAFVEVSCADGAGYILATSTPPDKAKPVKMTTCLAYEPGGNLFCELTDRASQLSVADKLLNGANGCTVTDRRYILASTDGSTYFEVACANKKGYVLQETKEGAVGKIIDCVEASMVPGGCTLTNTVEAKTEKAAFYSTVASKAGFKCNVEQYALFNTVGAKEAVEVKCSDRPDGAVIVSTKDGSQVFNCALSLAEGYKCSFTPIEATFPNLTAQLKNFSVKSYNCNVSKVGAILSDKAQTKRFIEVSCGAGEGVVVMVFKAGSNVLSEVTTCAEVGGCILPKSGV